MITTKEALQGEGIKRTETKKLLSQKAKYPCGLIQELLEETLLKWI